MELLNKVDDCFWLIFTHTHIHIHLKPTEPPLPQHPWCLKRFVQLTFGMVSACPDYIWLTPNVALNPCLTNKRLKSSGLSFSNALEDRTWVEPPSCPQPLRQVAGRNAAEWERAAARAARLGSEQVVWTQGWLCCYAGHGTWTLVLGWTSLKGGVQVPLIPHMDPKNIWDHTVN